MSATVILIGAGASFDAGMPLVKQLTAEVKHRLLDLHDIGGRVRPEFPALFDAITRYDTEAATNYERFFEWLSLICRGQGEPFHRLVCFRLEPHLIMAAQELAFVIKEPIWNILRHRHQCPTYQPSYFTKLTDFLPKLGRLKVFTTNYDLCVEDACRAQGVDVITGFHPSTGQWSPSLFRGRTSGINLYKLHGSLNWALSDDLTDLENRPLVECYPPQWDKEPDLLLGPGSKLQYDDPFVTLYAEFHRAIRRAKVCVAIGYSFRDDHIKMPIRHASGRGMKVINVNPSAVFDGYANISMGAKKALESGAIFEAMRSRP